VLTFSREKIDDGHIEIKREKIKVKKANRGKYSPR
jgi:hypothetical protein